MYTFQPRSCNTAVTINASIGNIQCFLVKFEKVSLGVGVIEGEGMMCCIHQKPQNACQTLIHPCRWTLNVVRFNRFVIYAATGKPGWQ